MPILLLTRPKEASRRFAHTIATELGATETVIAPLQRIEPVAAELPDQVAGLVLTSANAVARIPQLGLPAGLPAWCVGDWTAEAARKIGLDARSAEGEATALVEMILSERPKGPLLHLRGVHARGEVAARLTAAGVPCAARVVYAQIEEPLEAKAREVLGGDRPVVAPLFSPRSAELFAKNGPYAAPLHLIAISQAAADHVRPFAPLTLEVAAHPDGPAMRDATISRLKALQSGAP